MVKLIHDVIPSETVKSLPSSEVLIATLYIRGVSIQDIFGKYLEYDEHSAAADDELFGNDEEGLHGTRLSVGDAELVGLASIPLPPQPGRVF